MVDLETRTFCATHQHSLADAACDQCGKAMCTECRVEALTGGEVFCSTACMEEFERAYTQPFREGEVTPFTVGLKLWARALPAVIRGLLPLVLVMGLVVVLVSALARVGENTADPNGAEALAGFVTMALLGYGVLLTQTLLTKEYTGYVRGNTYAWTLHRLPAWVGTWFLCLISVFAGYVALIFPGIIVSLRLFWADEFALAHREHPVAALKSSWQLTENAMGSLFRFQLLVGLFGYLVLAIIGLGAFLLVSVLESLPGIPRVLPWMLGILVFFLAYGALHAPEIAKFYGMRAAEIHGRSADRPVPGLGNR